MVQVFDFEYVKELEKQGLKVISKNDKFVLMALDNKINFETSKLDLTKAVFTKRMTF